MKFYTDADGDYWLRDTETDKTYCLGSNVFVIYSNGSPCIDVKAETSFETADETWDLEEVQIAGG